MQLHAIDLTIILAYLASTVVIGFALKRRAHQDKRAFLLGGNRMPWYMLGLSNASGMFDISGTVWLVTILFVYGLQSIWLPWLWPVFNQIFLMVFLSIWIRRSGVTTGAEWLRTRFGTDARADRARLIMVVFALFMGLGALTYGFIGIGKFVAVFVPWSTFAPFIPFEVPAQWIPHLYGVVFMLFAILYSVLGGMFSIVWADLVQFCIMALGSLVIGVLAMQALTEQSLLVPEGWMSPLFQWRLALDWTGIIDEVNVKIAEDGFSLFTALFMMMVFKGILSSLAGPAPTADLQKILSTRSVRDAALMSGSVSVILMPVRYFMIGGFAVMGLLYYQELNLASSGRLDFEQILPAVIERFLPVGVLGLLLAGFLAAFISTFAATLNAAQAYVVNDLYLRYVQPDASRRQLAGIGYTSGILLAAVSIVCGFFAKDVNNVLQWLVSGLYGSYLAANLLKWYWWRFNATGFFWGMVAGLVPALTFRLIFDGVLDLYTFPLMFLVSLIACIVGTLAAPPVEQNVLKEFYRTVRPWGWWAPIHDLVRAEDPTFRTGHALGRDLWSILVGIVWQTALVLLPLYMILLQGRQALLCLGVIALTSWLLKRSWYDRLPAASSTTAATITRLPRPDRENREPPAVASQ